jgi:uncharacterized protein (TIGR02231 family)
MSENTTTLATPEPAPDVQSFPPVDPSAVSAELPVKRVTLLEDRAQIERRGKVKLGPGQHRLVVRDVAPVLRDVSLRVESETPGVVVVDSWVKRSMRVRREHQPDDMRKLEEHIEELVRRHQAHIEDRGRAERRVERLRDILGKGADEIPEDAGWGLVNQQSWSETFGGLFARVRELREEALDHWHSETDLAEEIERLGRERQAMDRPDQRFTAWVEMDIKVDGDKEVDLTVEYVVPNALWRPLHAARLGQDDKVRFSSRAAVWQNTGEDWNDVELIFSTARSSLGHEPPLLADDLLQAKKKSEQVVVQRREVKVQKASVGGGPTERALPQGVELPGVDDGGDVQNLRAAKPATVPSDGRPNIIPIFEFESEAEVQRVTMPELAEVVFKKATFKNLGTAPVLAGPVELIEETGGVGWTQTLFVAPQEAFELSFGPDDGLRVVRRSQQESDVDAVSKWTLAKTQTTLYLSNLGGEERTVHITERVPVSEIEHVRIDVLADACEPPPETDSDGFCRWKIVVPPDGRQRIRLTWREQTAPGVRPA